VGGRGCEGAALIGKYIRGWEEGALIGKYIHIHIKIKSIIYEIMAICTSFP
jgi:hypothetical protein